MIRVAAVGDVHYDERSQGRLAQQWSRLADHADLFLLAGDLTQSGSLVEVQSLLRDLKKTSVPTVSVLGNHDFHSDHQDEIRMMMEDAGIRVLEGDSTELSIRGVRVGIAGIKGFGGGFFGASCTEFGEPETKAFAHHSRIQADRLRFALSSLQTEYRFALLHFSPVPDTLQGEKREIYPFLGSFLLAEAIDSVGADGVFHGHAHRGTEKGWTQGGIPVRNVALPVIRHAFQVYTFSKREGG